MGSGLPFIASRSAAARRRRVRPSTAFAKSGKRLRIPSHFALFSVVIVDQSGERIEQACKTILSISGPMVARRSAMNWRRTPTERGDPHGERAWEQASDAAENKILISRSYKPASVRDFISRTPPHVSRR
jgi:hypothetical protein